MASAPRFQLVMMPVRVLPMMASSDDWMKASKRSSSGPDTTSCSGARRDLGGRLCCLPPKVRAADARSHKLFFMDCYSLHALSCGDDVVRTPAHHCCISRLHPAPVGTMEK